MISSATRPPILILLMVALLALSCTTAADSGPDEATAKAQLECVSSYQGGDHPLDWVVTTDACLEGTLTDEQVSCSRELQAAKPEIVVATDDERLPLILDNLFATVSCLNDDALIVFAGRQTAQLLSAPLARCVLDELRNSFRMPDNNGDLEDCDE